ncbi:hypothetical protein Tco_0820529 [Tanacetum coccineum]|uniref:Uncharacterized protein n=1 Tax=Tanacetum coccineum TaxID=301880 RepID=A0ABQ5A9N7_9ASTR
MEITSVTLLRNKCPLGKDGGVGSVHQGGDKRFAWSARVQGGDKEASMVVTRNVEGIVDITEFFRKLKFVCHWADPIKDLESPNVPGVKLSSFSKSDDTFLSLQALSDLYYLFGGFMDYLWSCELDISNFSPADRKILPVDDMMYSCLIEYPKHSALTARI